MSLLSHLIPEHPYEAGIILIVQVKNWRLSEWSDLLKVTQEVSDGVKMWHQA